MSYGNDIACGCVFQDIPYLSGTCGPALTLFMGIVENIVRSRCDIADPCGRLGRSDHNVNGETFDFVVVGAGVAGPAVAGRLVENLNWSVLLIEAGPELPTAMKIPAFAMSGVGTLFDWNYTTAHQENACLNTNGQCSWTRGKVVGGTNALNGMMYTRGHRSFYDSIAESGIRDWSYDDVLPFFKKTEGNLDLEMNAGFRGSDEPFTSHYNSYRPKLAEALVSAGKEQNYCRSDINKTNLTSVNFAQMMMRDGLRLTTVYSYLRPKIGQRNIKMITESQATRIIIDRDSKHAKGVEFVDKSGRTQIVHARKEVILSAGTVGSAQLLMLSGVGPKNDLETLGEKVIKDLPVGQNLNSDVSVSLQFTINETSTQTLTLEVLNEFLEHRTGPMSSNGIGQITGFLTSKYAINHVPDVQVFFDGYRAGCSRTGLTSECSDGELPSCCRTSCGRRSISIRPTNIRTSSVGTLKLRSPNPHDHPLIDPKYLSNKQDIEVLVEGIKIIINLTKTEALKSWDFRLETQQVSGCQYIPFGSDKYWACVIQRQTLPGNNQVGTCRMGAMNDPQSVVDHKLRVIGINGLRVVDASIFPEIPNGNTVGAILMAAERVVQFIKTTWNKISSCDADLCQTEQ